MEENKNNPLINDSFLWGVNISINEKTYTNKDIFVDNNENKKLNANSNNYEDILENINLIKNASDLFLQNIIDQNLQLKNSKEKKENIEMEE
jgi:hypothetical protein